IAIVNTKGVGFIDAWLYAYHKIAGATKSTEATSKASTSSTASKASTTPTTRNAQQILCGKVLLVHIVEITYQRDTAISVKEAYITSCLVTLVGTITGINTTKLPIVADATFGN